MDKKEDGIVLSKYQIQKALRKKGITNKKGDVTLGCFELYYDELCSGVDDACFHLPHKAWTGKKITQTNAENLACFLETSVEKLLPGSKRNSSVRLSSLKVRNILAERGIFTLKDFELGFDSWHGRSPDGADTGTPRKVWDDKYIAHNQAKKVADLLGVSVQELQPDSKSAWETLVYSPERQKENFMGFYGKDPGELGLAIFDRDDNNEELETHRVIIKWHLSLEGKRGDRYLIILRSDSQFYVLAPANYADHSNENTRSTLRYPQNKRAFSFDKREGLGFRELIAIRVPKSGSTSFFNERSDKTGHTVVLSELNSLANSLTLDQSLAGKIAVTIYPFMLIE